ncbi:MAG: Chloramphenicol acetyltransferase [Nitrosomonadaceae bacterium]|nr:Chloramphenicol acetyltransferase [Nitrosomonadaceae bacterium]
MIPCLEWARRALYTYRLRGRFPRSVIHPGAAADQGCVLGENSVLFRGAILTDSSLGAYSYVQSGSTVNNADVGPFCSIASGVIIGLGAHPTFMVSTSPVFYDKDQPLPRFFTKDRVFKNIFLRTVIEADVWVGQGAMVKAGVRIGVGAVIGSASMVTKDVPPYTIAAGNPCRPIRLRFPEDICQRLLDSRWWTFDEPRLERFARSFTDPEAFLAALKSSIE